MKNKFLIALFFVISLITTVNASVYDNPATISSFINELPNLNNNIDCKFKQEKHIANVARPIVSGGNFKFVKDKGVYFETTYPVKTNVSYTNKDYKQINDIILAISSRKYSKLEKEFNFFYKKDKENWILALKPKEDSQIIDYISSITICGEISINKISINLKNGNSTILWFITK